MRLNENPLDLHNTREFFKNNSNSRVKKKLLQEKGDEYFTRQIMVLRDFERPMKYVARIKSRKEGKRKTTLLRLMQEKEITDGEYTLEEHIFDLGRIMGEAIKKGYRPYNIREEYKGIIEFFGDTKTSSCFSFRVVYDLG